MKKFIYRVLENDEVVAIFNEQEYAQDFIAYEKTISDKQFEIEKVALADWLLQPREF
ncbi:hypothetical protein L6060_002704 [Enterococcus faecalis]|jgi:hypothetical protein|uniref:S.pyogenes plasmid pBT233 sequence (repS to erm1) n=7 Tax=Bacilli TaxID=91061 RepID=Q57042_STRPY|nr:MULTISPECIES: hypothetical protein [Bacilli]AET37223.1 alpha [Staphylococcus aureus]MCO4481124.1 hypothetical protein [Streptococcus infantarius subsp. infantarius]NQK94507.1 hypothetical protein [Streptococcus suis]HEO3765199.1 hypothetical protein [Streptococcus agalactiae]AAR27206.1 hypothetical protein [Streptococcus pyogenes]